MQIEAGSLRQRVKAGEFSSRDVLTWLRGQPHFSEAFERWLLTRIVYKKDKKLKETKNENEE